MPTRHDLTSLLPHTFSVLLPRGAWVDIMPAGEFLRRVAMRPDLMNGDGHPIPLDEITHRLRAHGNKNMLGFRDAERVA